MKPPTVSCERCGKAVPKDELSQDELCPECAEEFEALIEEDRRELNPEDFEDEDED